MNKIDLACAEPSSSPLIQALLDELRATDRLTEQGLERARRASEVSQERIDHVLLKLGLVDEQTLADTWSKVLDVPLVGPADVPTEPLLMDILSPRFVRSSGLLPLKIDGSRLRLGMADPLDSYSSSAVAMRTGMPVSLALIKQSDLEKAFEKLYPESMPSAAYQVDTSCLEFVANDLTRLQDLATDAPAIRLVESVIERAVEIKASDVHFTIGRNGARLRFRVDGILNEAEPPSLDLYNSVVSRLKILADLDIAERRLPQDGRIRLAVRGREIDLRLATMPHLKGEGVVLRILDQGAVKPGLDSLGFDAEIERTLRHLLNEPHGIVLVTGPTGSGKTTTLYAALRYLTQPQRNVVSVEDPVEYELEGVVQIQVQRKIGLDFPTVLRAVLRQDPDVIMIGEIRDGETAAIANQAALTGHFVLATLHTNSAAASLPRLIDMGLEPYLLSTTVRGILSQRLVRKLCPSCARDAGGAGDELAKQVRRLCANSPLDGRMSRIHTAVGCPKCHNTGYRGRTAIGELIVVDDEIRSAVLGRADAMRIDEIARAHAVVPLAQAGAIKVLNGETTLDELLRVTGENCLS